MGIWLIALIVVGIMLLYLGVRGRRVGDHPVCAKCGFDLFGRPEGVNRCGECGTFLEQPKSIRTGHRKRNGKLIGVGLTLLMPGMLVMILVLWGAVNGVSWLHYFPLGLLVHQATSADQATRKPAMIELASRFQNLQLTTEQEIWVIDKALAYQGELNKPWDSKWGDLIETTQAAGKLSPDRWNRYVSQSWKGVGSINTRPQVRLGDPLPYMIKLSGGRVGTNSRLTMQMDDVKIVWPSMSKDWNRDHSSNYDNFHSSSYQNLSSAGTTSGLCYASSFPSGISPGVVTVRMICPVTVGPATGFGIPQAMSIGELDLPASFTLLPADHPTVVIVHDPSLAEAIHKSLIPSMRRPTFGNPWQISTQVDVNGPPVGIAFDILFRDGTTETKVGSFACRAGTTNSAWAWANVPKIPPGPSVDMIFRNNPSAAAASIDAFQAWDGEIVFKGVPVK